jgi:hypothetical protein
MNRINQSSDNYAVIANEVYLSNKQKEMTALTNMSFLTDPQKITQQRGANLTHIRANLTGLFLLIFSRHYKCSEAIPIRKCGLSGIASLHSQ